MTLDSLRDFKWNASNCVPINSNIRDPRTARSVDRPVLIGPRFSKFCWSWSGQVPGFEIFLGPGPVRSQVLKFFSALVRSVLVRGSLSNMIHPIFDGKWWRGLCRFWIVNLRPERVESDRVSFTLLNLTISKHFMILTFYSARAA